MCEIEISHKAPDPDPLKKQPASVQGTWVSMHLMKLAFLRIQHPILELGFLCIKPRFKNATVCPDTHTCVGSSCIEVVQDELIWGFGFGYFLMEIKIIIQPALPQSSFILDVIFKIYYMSSLDFIY